MLAAALILWHLMRAIIDSCFTQWSMVHMHVMAMAEIPNPNPDPILPFNGNKLYIAKLIVMAELAMQCFH